MKNREIKFRFYTPDKRMIYEHDGWVEGIGINEAISLSGKYGYKIMQCIGLKDKNGKDMYESDICKIHFFHDGTHDIGVIVWAHDASFIIQGNSTYSPAFKSGGNFGDHAAVEVIGNIHENPQLLY